MRTDEKSLLMLHARENSVMNIYIAATLSIAVVIGPASALDVDLGGQVGGVGVGGQVGGVGVGGQVGGVGVGGQVGGVGVGGQVGGVGGQVGGVGSNGTKIGGTTTATVDRTKGARQSIALPRILWPSRAGSAKSSQDLVGYPSRSPAPVEAIPGTPNAVVHVCRQWIVSAAERFGAVHVHAVSAGPLRRERRGILTAPIQVRIDYDRQGGIEVRQARIKCRLDAAGRVIAVT
jgi:hypothetical protein